MKIEIQHPLIWTASVEENLRIMEEFNNIVSHAIEFDRESSQSSVDAAKPLMTTVVHQTLNFWIWVGGHHISIHQKHGGKPFKYRLLLITE